MYHAIRPNLYKRRQHMQPSPEPVHEPETKKTKSSTTKAKES